MYLLQFSLKPAKYVMSCISTSTGKRSSCLLLAAHPPLVSWGEETALDRDTVLPSVLSKDRDIGYQAWG